MVRLVFRPYTQVRRTICTSVSLRASTRVSSGFAPLRHSSPSFGSRRACSHSNPSQKIQVGRRCTPRWGIPPVSFLAPHGFPLPSTRTHVGLLGPCFKTGRMGSPQAVARSAHVPPRGHAAEAARAATPVGPTASPRANGSPGLTPPARPATVRAPSRAADRLDAVPHPTEAHRRPPSASLPAISSTL